MLIAMFEFHFSDSRRREDNIDDITDQVLLASGNNSLEGI